MNFLANQIKALRGELTLKAAASQARVSVGTWLAAEQGKPIKFSTLRKIRKAYRIGDRDWSEIVIGWIHAALEDDAKEFVIRPRADDIMMNDRGTAKNTLQQIQSELLNVSHRHQDEILKALKRPPVLNSITHLNELYDKVKER